MRSFEARSGGSPRPGGGGTEQDTLAPRQRVARAATPDSPIVARLVPTAFGVALGTVAALALFALAMLHASVEYADENALLVWLLGNNFLPGFAPTARGALAGLMWGFAHGFTLGWLTAHARNLFLRTCVHVIARRERLRADSHVLEELL